jgi:hypothetical protein
MASGYGTKGWAKWAEQNLHFALTLLREPTKQWDKEMSHLQAASKRLSLIQAELEEVINKKGG